MRVPQTPFRSFPLTAIAHRERGQGLAEYLIILVAIVVVVLVITVVFGGRIKQLFGIADAEVATMGAAEMYLEDSSYPGGGGSGGSSGGSGGSSGDSGGSGGGSGGSGGGSGGSSGGSGGSSGSSGGSSGGSGGGSAGSGGGGGGSGGGSGGSGGGRDEFGDGWGDSPGGSGGGSRGLAENYAATGRGATGGASADSDGIMRASKEGRQGVHQLGEGDDAVTVYSPGEDDRYKGSAKYDRDIEARKAAAEREAERRRWERKRRAAWDAEGSGGADVQGPNLTILLLIILLVLAGVVGARAFMGGS